MDINIKTKNFISIEMAFQKRKALIAIHSIATIECCDNDFAIITMVDGRKIETISMYNGVILSLG